MEEKVVYSREEIEKNIKVPAIVEVELRHIVESRLKQSGLYYRLFSRIKTSESLEKKFQIKNYNSEKKIQDLVGLRIDVYFEDDMKICRKMLEQMFSLVEWAESDQTDVEFKPVKINGVFKMPIFLRNQVSPQTWDMCIDDTVEIQIKTVFFEGWHEIEHDMKYKGGDLWGDRRNYSRYFNSILATLELCDKSMVSLFENLGHHLYKEGNWIGMMKAHYRLKMEEKPLYPDLEELLDNDHSENNLGKRLYKIDRQELVDMLLRQSRPVPINVNTMIALINQAVLHDERLDAIFRKYDVFSEDNDQISEELNFRRPVPLRRIPVFNIKVHLSERKYDISTAAKEAARLAHSWLFEKFGHLDSSIPSELAAFSVNMLGYILELDYRPEEYYWKLECRHIDMEAPGQVWLTEAECYRESGKQMLKVWNGYAVAGESTDYLNRYFSCPKFYSNIVDRIGVLDVDSLSTSRRIIREADVERIRELILSRERTLPLCLIVSEENDKGWLDESWLENFRVFDFTRMAGRYTHIYTCSIKVAEMILDGIADASGESRVYVFRAWSHADDYNDNAGDIKKLMTVYTPEDVHTCLFGRHQVRHDARRYDMVTGGQAFYHKLLYEMRCEMVD